FLHKNLAEIAVGMRYAKVMICSGVRLS
ncbi:hypothetical protein BMETH_5061861845, partial [methanotrophic bacterial endosymbiont of Bathymodiolus sp.]